MIDLESGRSEVVERATQDALADAGKRIKQIDETTRAGVRDRIREAIDQGMSPREAAEHVHSWSGWDEYRAERIARTETMFAYNSAAISSYREYGVTHVVADDGDKDAECAQRHGGTFTVGEAAEIFDHPNGTLDWLPVAPGIDPDQVRQELSAVREVAQAPFREPGGGETAGRKAEIEKWEKAIAEKQHAINPTPGRGTMFGPEEGAIFDKDGKRLWDGVGGHAHVDMSDPVAQSFLKPGNTVTHFHPDEGAVRLSAADIKLAMRHQVNMRAFHATGEWQEFAPRPGGVWGSPHGTIEFDVDVSNWKRDHPGSTWADAYDATLAEWSDGTLTSGKMKIGDAG